MAKKRKRKLQPHEKGFAKAILWAVGLALVITILSWPRERIFESTSVTVRSCNTTGHSRHSRTKLQIISTDGRVFHMYDAELPFMEIRKQLIPGTLVEVEYYEDWLVRLHILGARPVIKLTYNGQVLTRDTPVDNTSYFVLLWICPVIILFGFLNWVSGEHLFRKWKKKREKERKKRKRHEQTL